MRPEWWKAIYPDLVQQAIWFTQDQEDAKDLVQQVALDIILSSKEFQNEEHFKRWSFLKLKWIALDYFKKKNRDMSVFSRDIDITNFASTSNPEYSYIISKLSEEIERLPGRHKEIALMYYGEHKRVKDIASELEITQSTVRSFLRHIRYMLAERLHIE